MATVRFSAALKNEIMSRAMALFDGKLVKAKEAIPPGWDGRIYDLMFQNTTQHFHALPAEYFNQCDHMTVAGLRWDSRADLLPIRIDFGYERPFPVVISPELHGLEIRRRESYSNFTLNGGDARWDHLKAGYVKYCQDHGLVVAEQAKFVAGIKAILSTFSTLAPALKEWPALWDLIDESTKERHRSIIERKQRVVFVDGGGDSEAVDLNKMTAAVVSSKLTR